MKTFLVLGAAFGLIGVALGAFGSHALRSRLASERLGAFETGVRYQMWHALGLFVAGIVLFSGGLYALALTGRRTWGAVTPFGGACLLLGWASLLFAIVVK